MKKVFLFILIFFAAFSITSCAFLDDLKGSDSTSDVSNKHTVKFDTDGGTRIISQKIKDGQKAEEPTKPVKAGYTFDGWYEDYALTIKFNFNTEIKSDYTLYAKWNNSSVTTFSVVFNCNGGTAIATQNINAGSKLTKPTNPTRNEYKFIGWYTDEDLLNEYDFNIVVNRDVTLYAKWEHSTIPTYTIKFESNGGTDVTIQYIEKDSKVTKPANPERDGYTFVGWYSDAALTVVYDFNTAVTQDATIYAKWLIKKGVAFNTDGGSSVEPQLVEDGKLAIKPADPTKEGYTFKGWYTDENLTQAYNWSTPVTQNIMLYAKWDRIVVYCTVTFITNGGSTVNGYKVEEGLTATKPADPTKSGNSFLGWYSDAALTQQYVWSTPVTTNIYLYAKWGDAASEYSVILNYNGAGSNKLIKVPAGTALSEPTAPTRIGYEFDGWYKNAACTSKYDFSTLVNSSLTLYAKWNLIPVESIDVSGNSTADYLDDYEVHVKVYPATTAVTPKVYLNDDTEFNDTLDSQYYVVSNLSSSAITDNYKEYTVKVRFYKVGAGSVLIKCGDFSCSANVNITHECTLLKEKHAAVNYNDSTKTTGEILYKYCSKCGKVVVSKVTDCSDNVKNYLNSNHPINIETNNGLKEILKMNEDYVKIQILDYYIHLYVAVYGQLAQIEDEIAATTTIFAVSSELAGSMEEANQEKALALFLKDYKEAAGINRVDRATNTIYFTESAILLANRQQKYNA